MKRDFWKSWTRDYLQQLQQRYKWKTTENNISIGTLVLMKEDNINPSNWPLAKVKEIHKSNDGLVRVVTLKKSSGAIQKQSIHTLIPLPINADLSHQSQTKVNTNITTCYSNKSPRSYRGTSKWLLCLLIMLQLFGTMIATQTYTVKNLSPGFLC
ncbi:hypothetical protein HF086_016752 [Spodoptera exigua]|uniref:DUF5641 domain-containing protein n=1 Tax=Spodoptera exigua TaxID=7107 RepID=A0A922MWA6_SPOEX|nr:hypothetical protein HF086_016752 [Spodoptera exigua]